MNRDDDANENARTGHKATRTKNFADQQQAGNEMMGANNPGLGPIPPRDTPAAEYAAVNAPGDEERRVRLRHAFEIGEGDFRKGSPVNGVPKFTTVDEGGAWRAGWEAARDRNR